MNAPATLSWRSPHALVPVLACAVLAAVWGASPGAVASLGVVLALFASVLVAVHHAEVIALRLGEPLGTLVLALAVTVIEVSLIVALMLSGGESTAALARDTVFATVMIIVNGVIGLCLLLGAWRHHVIDFRVEGTAPGLSVLATLATLTLVLPSFTSSTPGPTLSTSQSVFAGFVSLALYAVFLFVQTVRHRDYFLPLDEDPEAHAERPSNGATLASFALLLACLVAVVGLAKVLAPRIEQAVDAAGVPRAAVGVAVALLVLLPETGAAARAALRNRMQTSFNLAFGSALATIGLSIPAVVATSLVLRLPLTLGLESKDIVLLALSLLIASITVSRGHATVLQGAVHLVLFLVFLFMTAVP